MMGKRGMLVKVSDNARNVEHEPNPKQYVKCTRCEGPIKTRTYHALGRAKWCSACWAFLKDKHVFIDEKGFMFVAKPKKPRGSNLYM